MPKMEATLAIPAHAAMASSAAADTAARRLTLDERFEREAVPHTRSLYSTAYRLTRNSADAEDLVQETFLRAYRAFEGYTPDTNIRAWLYTILYRVRADHYRRIGRSVQTVELEGDGPGTAPSQDQLARGHEDVARALGELPECFRAAVILRDIQEFSYEEISTILDIPIGTVMSRIHRGRALLRKSLAGLVS